MYGVLHIRTGIVLVGAENGGAMIVEIGNPCSPPRTHSGATGNCRAEQSSVNCAAFHKRRR